MDPFEEVTVTTRLTLAELETIAEEVGAVDGIPMAVTSRQMMHRHGLFSLKDDQESWSCQRREDEGTDHGLCVQSVTTSSDICQKNAMIAYMSVAQTLKAEAFDDYDAVRFRSSP